jgi:nitrite reductase (NADH) small subunit/3-phenylpropionate/trans-cinnamate dioxygenase ferredoxin subunit
LESMNEFARVADAASIAPGGAAAFTVGRYEVAVFNADGTFYALENACPHQGGPLADGWLEGATITCPWHAWCFDLRTGKITLGDFATVPRFDVRVERGGLFVSLEPIA